MSLPLNPDLQSELGIFKMLYWKLQTFSILLGMELESPLRTATEA